MMCDIKHGHDYSEDAGAEMGNLAEKQRDGWRNLAVVLTSVVLVLVGAFIGDLNASWRYKALTQDLSGHTSLTGHPVIVERVDGIAEDLGDIKEHQEENGKLLAKVAGALGVSE